MDKMRKGQKIIYGYIHSYPEILTLWSPEN